MFNARKVVVLFKRPMLGKFKTSLCVSDCVYLLVTIFIIRLNQEVCYTSRCCLLTTYCFVCVFLSSGNGRGIERIRLLCLWDQCHQNLSIFDVDYR